MNAKGAFQANNVRDILVPGTSPLLRFYHGPSYLKDLSNQALDVGKSY